MKTSQFVAAVVCCSVLVAPAAPAQMAGGARPKDPSEHLAKIFGKDAAFSADALVTVSDKAGRELHAMEMSYAVLGGRIRTEIDLARMRGADMPPEARAQVQQMGMDRTINILVPAKNIMYVIYPGMKAYCEMSLAGPGRQPGDTEKQPEFEKTELGKDTIDGHPCIKHKVVIVDNGRKTEGLLWEATDLKNFPIQTQFSEQGATVTTRFKNINQSRPAASLFEPPADYTRYGSLQELMMSQMQRFMGGE